jgi:phosphoribosyl-ATP pyrophosphohydrolase/phosphoribosyl-AMP cyclohydrolase
MDTSIIKFGPDGLVPAIAQDADSLEVLMLAYMNAEALEKTLSSGRAHYWSRSRKKLWCKGETSGNFQEVLSVRYDCDADTILLTVRPAGPACHTGEKNCFYRALKGGTAGVGGAAILTELFKVLKSRKGADPKGSYVASLYAKGLGAITGKIEEESGELIRAAEAEGPKELVHETADLWFHTLVLLAEKGIGIEEIFGELEGRFGTSGHDEKRSRED